MAEARRLHLRYTVELVERFNLCPFARHARTAGEVSREVLLHAEPDPAPTLALIVSLEERPAPPPVVLVLYPRLTITPRAFDELASRIKDLDQKRHGGRPVWVSATFHPDYPLDLRSPGSIVPFLRRSPDPSLQLVRLAVLDEARGPNHGTFVFDYSPESWEELRRRTRTRTVQERIADDNRATLDREGAAAFEAIQADILRDRAASYARFRR